MRRLCRGELTAKVVEGTFKGSVWVDADEGVARDPFPALDRLQKKCVIRFPRDFEVGRNRRQQIRKNRFRVNHRPLFLPAYST